MNLSWNNSVKRNPGLVRPFLSAPLRPSRPLREIPSGWLRPGILLVLALLAACPAHAGEFEFQRQTLALPTNAVLLQSWVFDDIDGDGRADLLALDPDLNKIWIYRQTAGGFPPLPQQTLELPVGTAW